MPTGMGPDGGRAAPPPGAARGGPQDIDSFERVAAVVRRLRAPGGCPWDREQTHSTLQRFALEEAREVVAAIGGGDPHALCEELGDLLLQVLLHAAIAEDEGVFTLADVLDGLSAKLVRRHPHVFGDAPPASTPEEVAGTWRAVKAAEAAAKGDRPPARLDAVPRGQAALAEADQLGRRVAEVGFDWPTAEAAWPKVVEEQRELEEAWRAWSARGRAEGPARAHTEEELGDLLFSLAQVGRLLGLHAEVALARANDKFRRRFTAMEGRLATSGGFDGKSLEALDRVWDAVKSDSQAQQADRSSP